MLVDQAFVDFIDIPRLAVMLKHNLELILGDGQIFALGLGDFHGKLNNVSQTPIQFIQRKSLQVRTPTVPNSLAAVSFSHPLL